MDKSCSLYLIWILILFTKVSLYSQSPQGIPYQGVARNASGAILANQPITLRMSIHDTTTTGTVVYNETHTITTTALGQFSITIGLGTPITATFASINWGNGAKFLQVELSTNAGNSYLDMGTTQFMSVPYALYAGSSSNGVTTHYIGESYGGGIVFYVYDNGQHGLIAATSDQTVNDDAITAVMGYCGTGCVYNLQITPANFKGIGAGMKNSMLLMSQSFKNDRWYSGGSNFVIQTPANYAPLLALNYSSTQNGITYGDWYLPSYHELQLLYNQRNIVGGFNLGSSSSTAIYLSSQNYYQYDVNGFYSIDFSNGNANASNYGRVRAIRTF